MRQFYRGERARLADLAAINHLWEVRVSVDDPAFIVDFCCLGLDANGQIVDERYLISYNQPEAPQDAIRLYNTANNEAIFSINLARLPATIRRVVFTAVSHKSVMPEGMLGAALSWFVAAPEIGQGHLILSTPAKDTGFLTFSGQDFGTASTLILGELYWRDEWRFVAAGQPVQGELSAFLRTLTDGPTPVPPPVTPSPNLSPFTPSPFAPPPVVSSPVVPPRPPHVTAPTPPSSSPRPVPQAPLAVAPAAPISTPVRATAPPAATQPAEQSIAPQPLPALPTRPVPPSPSQPTLLFPQSLPPGGKLQDLIDAATPGSTLTLMRDEYQGPVVINKALVLECRDSALWAKVGPVLTITAPDVTLHNLDIEVTVAQQASDERGVALKVQGQQPRLQLHNVRVRGRISGLGDEDGEWQLPTLLDLGQFAPRANNQFYFTVSVPTSVQISSPVAGLTLSPSQVEAGQHRISLEVRDVAPETLIIGHIEVRSASVHRTIPLSGSAIAGVAAKLGVEI